jgi:AraC family transcriptional regulator
MSYVRTGGIKHVRAASNDKIGLRHARWPGLADSRAHPFLFDCGAWRVAAALEEAGSGAAAGLETPRVLPRQKRAHNNGQFPLAKIATRGGLSGWQQKKVADFIEEHLTEELRLAALARLVDLSPFHFARAFRQSFGLPPHRYHNGRRMERAKMLLAERANSVTEIARILGFAETSSFSAAFRRMTGTSPRDYRRNLD